MLEIWGNIVTGRGACAWCRNIKGMNVMLKWSEWSTQRREKKRDGGLDPTGILSDVVRDLIVKGTYS